MAVNSFTTAEEDRAIRQAFDELLRGYLASNHRKKVEIIERAFRFANEAHKGIRRRSGEPYIMHPIAVARIVQHEIGLGSTSICAALLHDVVEDTDYTVEDISRNFGPKIAQLVDGLTKISGGIFGEKASAQAENIRRLLLTMSEDIRVVIIKMADRLHNMRTLGSMAPNKQHKIAGETLYIYAPLAHRLGLFAIKTELEDLAFKYEHPEEHAVIEHQIKASEAERQAVFRNFATPITEKLGELGLKFRISARVKSVYSIWNKMQTKHVPFSEVYDLYAVRIVFDLDNPDDTAAEKATCWQIYSAITDLYRLHPERTRDWISSPKINGYQALHLTVMGPDGNWVEVQIRSSRMHEIAEKGFAAHWRYKIGDTEEETELNNWIRTIKDILDNPEPNAIDFLDTLKLNLYAQEILVFTPKGEMLTMPVGSTVLDVAFNLHSHLGTHCIAGKINHKLVPLSYRLSSGDQVEVLTSNSQRPKPEWINFLATAKGKTRLRKALRSEIQPAIRRGRQIYDQFLADNSIAPSNEVLTKLMGLCRLLSTDDLFAALGRDEITLNDFHAKTLRKQASSTGLLSKIFRRKKKKKAAAQAAATKAVAAKPAVASEPINTKDTFILNYDAASSEGSNFVFADCCHPIPGDPAIGFINDDGIVEVHSIDCPRAQALKASFGPRLLSVAWGNVTGLFAASVAIDGIDRFGILQELIGVISTHLSINIRALHIDTDCEVFHCTISLLVPDVDTINSLTDAVSEINGVEKAARINNFTDNETPQTL